MEQAACLGKTYLHDSVKGMFQLQELCQECPVKRQCLDLGMSDKNLAFSGMIYGGLFPDDLESLWRIKELQYTPWCMGCDVEFQVYNWDYKRERHIQCMELLRDMPNINL